MALRVKTLGEILSDDMGLEKTLTILALIMTNFHDRRPLDEPMLGQKRGKIINAKPKLTLKRVGGGILCPP